MAVSKSFFLEAISQPIFESRMWDDRAKNRKREYLKEARDISLRVTGNRRGYILLEVVKYHIATLLKQNPPTALACVSIREGA